MMRTKKILYLILLLIVCAIVITGLISYSQYIRPLVPLVTKDVKIHQQQTGVNFPYVKGAQIFYGNNQPLLLHGAMIETSFAYMKQCQAGKNPLAILNTQTFNAMAQQWHMNVVRINISQWIYNLDPATYMSKLDTAVQQANAAGFYVILDFHDNPQSGAVSPYSDGMLHTPSLTWWKMLATHYINNSMIMFDVLNEPTYTTWTTWLHGDGADVVGFADTIAAIRSTGARQIIVVEPGKAGGGTPTEGGWATFNPTTLTDPNIIFSRHIYQKIISGNPTTWDHDWGSLLNTHPIYYGEWALLPDPYITSHCTGLTSANADPLTNAFLNYLSQRNANWTAWDFLAYNLIQNTSSYTPTTFNTGSSWRCGDPSAAHAGMGLDVKNHMNNLPTSNPGRKKHACVLTKYQYYRCPIILIL